MNGEIVILVYVKTDPHESNESSFVTFKSSGSDTALYLIHRMHSYAPWIKRFHCYQMLIQNVKFILLFIWCMEWA